MLAKYPRFQQLARTKVRASAYVPSPILYPDENNAAGRVGKGDNRALQSLGRRRVALELEGLAFGVAPCVEEVDD